MDYTKVATVNWAMQSWPRLGFTNLATDGPYKGGHSWTIQKWPQYTGPCKAGHSWVIQKLATVGPYKVDHGWTIQS